LLTRTIFKHIFKKIEVMKTFLMRFEEKALSEDLSDGDGSSTATANRTASTNGNQIIIAGTKTLTEVRRETVDTDPTSSTLFAFPR